MPTSDLPALDNRHVKTSTADVLVDRVVPGEILVIAFGFVSWEKRPDFDFYGRLKKLEQASGRHINKILVRDSGNSWYHRKIDGLGEHPDQTAAGLRQLIGEIRPSKVITIGQSMGAYAAIMYGLLLEVRQVIAFGPLSFLDPQQALLYHERRWLAVMRDLHCGRRPRATMICWRWAAPRRAPSPSCTSCSAPSRMGPAAASRSTWTPCTRTAWRRWATARSILIRTPAIRWSST